MTEGAKDPAANESEKRVFMLMYEDTNAAKSVNSVYVTRALAEAWMGRLIEELLVDAGLANEDDSGKIAAISQLLEAGEVGAAASAFNDLQGDQVWIEDADVVMSMPAVGQAVGYIQ
jgi:hypothetical protein